MKKLFQLLILLSLTLSLVNAKDDWLKNITPAEALKAIKIFEKDPLGEKARGALIVVTNFAKYNDSVMLQIDKELLPWVYKKDKKLKHSRTLLGAYIAGNVKARLNGSKYKDNRYDGAVMVIDVYKMLRDKNASEDIDSIEEWIDLKENGNLKDVVKNK